MRQSRHDSLTLVAVVFPPFGGSNEGIVPWQAAEFMEHRMGVEPMNTGFADQRVSHFATGAHLIASGGSIAGQRCP
jgi:hypothetical protein